MNPINAFLRKASGTLAGSACLVLASGCQLVKTPFEAGMTSMVNPGTTVETTLDPSLQAYAEELFSSKDGYIVALDPGSGEVLAMLTTSVAADTHAVIPLVWNSKENPGTSPLQLSAYCAAIANRGYCYMPHLGKGENVLRMNMTDNPDSIKAVVEQMWRDVNSAPGTGGRAWIAHVDGLDVCGRVAEVAGDGGTDSVFIGFAPMDAPQIAIAVCVEKGGPGARVAAPIGSLVIEHYLNGQVSRTDLEHRMMAFGPKGRKK